MTRKWLLILSALFILMGCYEAWKEQYLRAQSAEKNSDLYLSQTREYSHYYNELLVANKKGQSPSIVGGGAIIGNSNTALTVGANNSGNAAQIFNSPNASLTQSIINPLPPSFIESQRFISQNIPDGILFKTEIALQIANTSKNTVLTLLKYPDSVVVQPEYRHAGFETVFLDNGTTVNTTTTLITFVTSNKVQESDFKFSVTNTPDKSPSL